MSVYLLIALFVCAGVSVPSGSREERLALGIFWPLVMAVYLWEVAVMIFRSLFPRK